MHFNKCTTFFRIEVRLKIYSISVVQKFANIFLLSFETNFEEDTIGIKDGLDNRVIVHLLHIVNAPSSTWR